MTIDDERSYFEVENADENINVFEKFYINPI